MLSKFIDRYRTTNVQFKVVLWFTFVGFLQRGISILTTPIFTRVLSPEEYGMFSVFSAWYGVIAIVATLNLHMGVINNAFVKEKQSKERIVSSFQSLSLVVSLAFLLMGFLFREQLSQIMGLPVIVVVFLFLGFVFTEPYQDWLIYKRYQYDYKKPIIVTIMISVFTPCASLLTIFLVQTAPGEARIISYVLAGTIIPGIMLYIVNYRRNRTFYDRKLWLYALSFNLPLLPHYLSETLLNQIDRIMINAYFGAGDAGVYSIAFSAASIIMIFSSALNMAFVPWQYQKLKEKDYRAMRKAAYAVLTFLAVLLSILIMFAPEIIAILAGEQYLGAIYLIPTLGASVFFNYMYQVFSRVEMYYEKKSYTVIATMTAVVVNILLNMWWIPEMGYTGAGYSTLVAHILFCVMHYIFYLRVSKEFMNSEKIYNGKVMLLISCVVIGLAIIVTLLYQSLTTRIALLIVILLLAIVFRKRILQFIREIRRA